MEKVIHINKFVDGEDITYVGTNAQDQIIVAAAFISGNPSKYYHIGEEKLGSNSIIIYDGLRKLYLQTASIKKD